MSKKSNITILKSADCWKLELQSALDFVETDGACGSLEDLYAATNILYARLCERFPGGDFTQIPRVYELLANHRHHQLGLSELQPMANAAVMVVGRISDELVKDHRNSKNGGREQSTNDRMLAIFTKDKRCVGKTPIWESRAVTIPVLCPGPCPLSNR